MGHGLGLMHSSSYGAVMAPYYPGYKDDIQLSKDDLDGIHKNYGKLQSSNVIFLFLQL